MAGREPQKREAGAVTDVQIDKLNKDLGLQSLVLRTKKYRLQMKERANLVLILSRTVLFEVLTVALQTPQESPSTMQNYEK